ncbi:unnamed protein product [Closterium sp. NIES-54]
MGGLFHLPYCSTRCCLSARHCPPARTTARWTIATPPTATAAHCPARATPRCRTAPCCPARTTLRCPARCRAIAPCALSCTASCCPALPLALPCAAPHALPCAAVPCPAAARLAALTPCCTALPHALPHPAAANCPAHAAAYAAARAPPAAASYALLALCCPCAAPRCCLLPARCSQLAAHCRAAYSRVAHCRATLPPSRHALLLNSEPSHAAAHLLPCSTPSHLFDAEGRPIEFESWLEDLHMYLQSVTQDDVSLFEHTSGSLQAPKTPAELAVDARGEVQKPYRVDRIAYMRWTARTAAATHAVRAHLSLDQRAQFCHVTRAQAIYDAVVRRYSSPSTAMLGHLALPSHFPELSPFAAVADRGGSGSHGGAGGGGGGEAAGGGGDSGGGQQQVEPTSVDACETASTGVL